MKNGKQLAQELSQSLHSAQSLRRVSDFLEELAQDKSFRSHTRAIVSDSELTTAQKKRQLQHLIKAIDHPQLNQFLSQVIDQGELWLFDVGRVDYFDTFVRHFQKETENIELVYLLTAIELDESELAKIAQDLGKAFGYRVVIKHEVDPKIIGGIRMRVENLVFDLSLKTKFTQFQRSWIASLVKTEKQVGRNQPDNFS